MYEVEPLDDGVQVVVQSELVTNETMPVTERDPRAAAALSSPLVSDMFHGADVEADALVRDAILDDLGFLKRQREHPGPLLDRHDEAAVAGHNPELGVLPPVLGAGDQERLVGRRYVPEEHMRLPVAHQDRNVTKTERADMHSTTATLLCLGTGSSDQAANASVPPRTGSSTSPGPCAGMETVILPMVPTRSCSMSATAVSQLSSPAADSSAPGPLVIDSLYPFLDFQASR